MVKPLASADCWILVKEGEDEHDETLLFDCFLLDLA